jgi:cell division protein FtsX
VKLRPAYLHYAAITRSQAIARAAGVEEVQFGGEWIRRLDQFLNPAHHGRHRRIIGAVSVVVANAIRLTVVARRDVHRVMVLLGASRRFCARRCCSRSAGLGAGRGHGPASPV